MGLHQNEKFLYIKGHHQQSKRIFPGGAWLRLHAPSARVPSSSPSQETRPHMLPLKNLHATMKTADHAGCNQLSAAK